MLEKILLLWQTVEIRCSDQRNSEVQVEIRCDQRNSDGKRERTACVYCSPRASRNNSRMVLAVRIVWLVHLQLHLEELGKKSAAPCSFSLLSSCCFFFAAFLCLLFLLAAFVMLCCLSSVPHKLPHTRVRPDSVRRAESPDRGGPNSFSTGEELCASGVKEAKPEPFQHMRIASVTFSLAHERWQQQRTLSCASSTRGTLPSASCSPIASCCSCKPVAVLAGSETTYAWVSVGNARSGGTNKSPFRIFQVQFNYCIPKRARPFSAYFKMRMHKYISRLSSVRVCAMDKSVL